MICFAAGAHSQPLPAPPALKTAQVLLTAGFIWDENYQKACEDYAHGVNHFDAKQIKSLTPLLPRQPTSPPNSP